MPLTPRSGDARRGGRATPATRPGRLGRLVLWLVGGTWALTMTELVRREVVAAPESADVRELMESARLKKAHAGARFVVRLGALDIGEFSSTVSGGQREEQLAYALRGHLERPLAVDLRGFVLADWDRRVERFVLEARVGPARHRLDGAADAPGVVAGPRPFRVRYRPPDNSTLPASEWVLPEAPVLAPGPLPIPDLALFDAPPGSGAGPSGRSGAVVDPLTGEPRDWSLAAPEPVDVEIAGRARAALRHDLRYGDVGATIWAEASGFPLKLELPPGVTVVLVEEWR